MERLESDVSSQATACHCQRNCRLIKQGLGLFLVGFKVVFITLTLVVVTIVAIATLLLTGESWKSVTLLL